MQSKNQNIGARYHGSTFYQPKYVNFVANQFSIGIAVIITVMRGT